MNGKLSDSGIQSYQHFAWEIQNFFSLPLETGDFLQSDEFRFAGDLYCLRLYPRGRFEYAIDLVEILLVRLASSVPEKSISYDIGYYSSTGGKFRLVPVFDLPGSDNDCLESVGGLSFHATRREVEENTCGPFDILRVYCRIRMSNLSVLPLHGEEEKKLLPGVDKLQSDYKRLLMKGAEKDACLVVSGKEFHAHRCILRARSPVFERNGSRQHFCTQDFWGNYLMRWRHLLSNNRWRQHCIEIFPRNLVCKSAVSIHSLFEAMFGHETEEKESGRVVIDDLKPDRFEDFLEYLYTGRIEAFSDGNAFGLYAAADKYDLPTLRSECVQYMNRSLSVDNFCDVITLALQHREKDLLELAVEFFKKNVGSILLTAKWQQFMSENSARANELLIKVHVRGKESDSVLLL